ncbi:hypothetical protein DFJ63DRAFT_312780 [Scheffersomyces coipomensis]|uniref:uncharacterized protein n=1 Tax=Scheffersomyces coipomensis TaxID=1788519 RepID=UPI00315CD647
MAESSNKMSAVIRIVPDPILPYAGHIDQIPTILRSVITIVDNYTIPSDLNNLRYTPFKNEGTTLVHNRTNISNPSSNFFNIASLYPSYLPVTIIFQFILGANASGSEMNDLLNKAFKLKQLGGTFNLVLKIFKIQNGDSNSFKLPSDLKRFGFVGFEIDTDLITESYEDINTYKKWINTHLEISLSFLGDSAQYVSVGQKIKITDTILWLHLPCLRYARFESYDISSQYKVYHFLNRHKDTLEKVVLRDSDFSEFRNLTRLKSIQLIGVGSNVVQLHDTLSVPVVMWLGISNPKFHINIASLDKKMIRLHFSTNPDLTQQQQTSLTNSLHKCGINFIYHTFQPHYLKTPKPKEVFDQFKRMTTNEVNEKIRLSKLAELAEFY